MAMPRGRHEKILTIHEEYEKDPVITHDELIRAIVKTEDGKMPEEVAKTIAKDVLSFFGYDSRITDNRLDPQSRDNFYMLEDSGLVETRREETTLPISGKNWIIEYWLLKKRRIRALANHEEVEETAQDVKEIYADDKMWDELYSTS